MIGKYPLDKVACKGKPTDEKINFDFIYIAVFIEQLRARADANQRNYYWIRTNTNQHNCHCA